MFYVIPNDLFTDSRTGCKVERRCILVIVRLGVEWRGGLLFSYKIYSLFTPFSNRGGVMIYSLFILSL